MYVCLWERGRQRESRKMKHWLAQNQATWLSKPTIHLPFQLYGCNTFMQFCLPIKTLSLVLLQFQGLTFNICGWINKYMNRCLKDSLFVCVSLVLSEMFLTEGLSWGLLAATWGQWLWIFARLLLQCLCRWDIIGGKNKKTLFYCDLPRPTKFWVQNQF